MEELKELGLSTNESKVYTTLLEAGKMGAGEVAKFSGVSYSRIYEVLDSLEQKGLVKIVPEKTKKFVPASPKELLDIVKKKEENLVKIKDKIKKMEKLYSSKEVSPVVLGYGKKAFYKIVKDSKECKKYSYGIKWTSEFRHDWAGETERKLKRGNDIKVLTRYNSETKKNINEWLKINKNIRKISNDGIAMSVVDDAEVIITLINANTTLLIKDKAFAKIIKKMFLETYKNAEKIK